MKKLILIILIIASLPIRAVGYKADEHNWANSTYAFQPALTCGQYDMRHQTLREISAANFSTIQEESTGSHKGPRRIGRDDLDDDDLAIGEAEWRSPVGDAIWPMLIFIVGYALWYRRKMNTI